MPSTTKTTELASTAAAARMMDATELEYMLHDIRTARRLAAGNQTMVDHFTAEESIFAAALRRHEET